MSIVVGAGIGVIGLAIALRRFLPKAPLFNRLVLEPPPPEERITLSHREALADYSHLIGVTGEAMTDLRPGGRAAILTFHSGEDRLVAAHFAAGLSSGIYVDAPVEPTVPAREEVHANPRSRSARLRWGRRSV